MIAKAIRTTPYNYTRPLPLPEVEYSLRGAIYDSYIRRIVWEGIRGKWRDELESWVTCPEMAPEPEDTPLSFKQQVLSTWNTITGKEPFSLETDDDVICPFAWAEPIHALNCDIVWPPALDEPPYSHAALDDVGGRRPPSPHPQYLELDTPEYAGVIADQWILEKLLAQGGIRLAGMLNYLFADSEGDMFRGCGGLRIYNPTK